MKLKGKRIVLGITGSIAAYKGVELLRELQKKGAEVRVAITEAGKAFIGVLTLEALTGKPVYQKVIPERGEEIPHTQLARWADLLIVAPATANTIAKIACGIADTPVSEVALCLGRGIIAPAMNDRMFENPITQENLRKLKKLGWEVVEPDKGYLACGEEGKGRLAEVRNIAEAAEYWFYPKLLKGKRVVITAGPTREYIDPVRFISNPSSGRMGYALAKAAAAMGADVVLISGKTCLEPPYKVKRIVVETVEEMKEAALREFEGTDIYISAAAVGDYTPAEKSSKKIKKGSGELTISFKRTPDILKIIGQRERKGQVVVGFAAETDNLIENAKEKLKKKNLDLIVANSVAEGVFGSSQTRIFIVNRKGEVLEVRGSKEKAAEEILKRVAEVLEKGAEAPERD